MHLDVMNLLKSIDP